MFKRQLSEHLHILATQYPALAILGPRQSGKTTLSRLAFPNHIYLSLEDHSTRERATLDPKGFFDTYKDAPGIILDEFQNTPKLLSDIQLIIDAAHRPGYFILTGSQNFLMNEAITQTLAGRIGICTLLPLSIHELIINNLMPTTANRAIFNGGYPRIYQQSMEPAQMYPDYIETYVERDVRLLIQVSNLSLFRKFVGLCAGRIGQLLNLESLASDCGISGPTARAWLTLLEASYVVFLLQPHHTNFGKRLIKSPKIYFYDTGLACSLLGITSELQLSTHYLRGGLFESFIIADVIKQFYSQRLRPRVYFWRDSQGHELDLVIEHGNKLLPLEIKASQTIDSSFFGGLQYWNNFSGGKPSETFVVYAGPENQAWPQGQVISWQKLPQALPKLP